MKLTAFLFFFTLISFSQSKIKSYVLENSGKFEGRIDRIDSFPSKFIVPRAVDIWLPKNYTATKNYNVLYMHDGQMLFDSTSTWNKQEWKVDEVASQLMQENKVQNFIVVAIWNIPEIRHKDLFPNKVIQYLKKDQIEILNNELVREKGFSIQQYKINSDNYLKFIVQELKPFIDKNYSVHTTANHTAIMGSSMGGLISMYALCEYPNVFGKAACLSTHWIGFREFKNNPIPESFFAYMEKNLPEAKNHKIYFDYGTETLDADYIKYAYRVDETLTSKGYTYKNYRNIKFENENHSEASWQKRINIPLEFMFGN